MSEAALHAIVGSPQIMKDQIERLRDFASRAGGSTIQVRDSKDPDGPVLSIDAFGARAWIAAATRGELDHLARPE